MVADNAVSEKPRIRSSSSKNKAGRVPKKIHKAEREKLKRDSLNVLFLKLSDALDATLDNNGKASLLGCATRAVRDLLVQVECLRSENTTLLSESHYVFTEKSELTEENSVLQAQITELRTEVQNRTHSGSTMNSDQFPSQHGGPTQEHQTQKNHLAVPTADNTSVLGQVFVVPIHHQHIQQVFQEPDAPVSIPNPSSTISRPYARYPSSSDSWPLQILARDSEAVHETEK